MKQRVIIVAIVLGLLVLGGGIYLYSGNPLPVILNTASAESNTVSGFIEGHDVNVAPEIGGRITTISVREGDSVTAGQVIAQLDHSLLDAQIEQAQAAVDTAQAQYKQLANGPPM
jgi:multidrug efflux pump subunit AcrA (membrane-fusion protein)